MKGVKRIPRKKVKSGSGEIRKLNNNAHD